MKTKLHRLFQNIKEIDPPAKLENVILSKIVILKEKQKRRRLIFSCFRLAGSFGLFFLALYQCGKSFIYSDFWNLFKLLFSDAKLVAENWNDFLFSLMENFPLASVIAMLIPLFILLVSFSLHLNSMSKNNHNHHNYNFI